MVDDPADRIVQRFVLVGGIHAPDAFGIPSRDIMSDFLDAFEPSTPAPEPIPKRRLEQSDDWTGSGWTFFQTDNSTIDRTIDGATSFHVLDVLVVPVVGVAVVVSTEFVMVAWSTDEREADGPSLDPADDPLNEDMVVVVMIAVVVVVVGVQVVVGIQVVVPK